MKECKKCGCENLDEAIVCKECWQTLGGDENGQPIEENLQNQFNEKLNIEQNEDDEPITDQRLNLGDQDIVSEESINYNQQNNCNNKEESKKMSKKIKYGIVGIVSILIVVLGIKVLGVFASPGDKVLKSLGNILKKNEINGNLKLSFKFAQELGVPSIANDLAFESQFSSELKSGISNSKNILILKNKPLIEFGLASDKDNLYVDLYDVYDKIFFMKLNQDSSLKTSEGIKFGKYLEKAKIQDILPKEYIDKLSDILDKNIKKEDGKYVLTVDSKVLGEILKSMVEIANNDEKLAKNLYSKLAIVRDEMKKDNYKPTSQQYVYIQQFLESLPTEAEFINKYKESVKELKENINKEPIKDMGYKFIFKFDIDMSNNIKVLDFQMDYDGTLISLTFDTTKKFKGKSYSAANAVNIEQVMQDQNMQKQVLSNLLNKALKNEELIKFLEENNIIETFKQMYGTDNIEEIVDIYIEQMLGQMFLGEGFNR